MIDEKETEIMGITAKQVKKTKGSIIAFRIDEQLKARLQHAAQQDRRSLSQYIEILLTEHINSLNAQEATA